MKFSKNYKELSIEQLEKLKEYYQSHTLDECCIRFRIKNDEGVAQWLSRNAPKNQHGGARHKSNIDSFYYYKAQLIETFTSAEQRKLLETLLLLHKEKIANEKK